MNLVRRAWVAPAALIAIAVVGLVPSCGDDGIGPGEAEVTVSGTARVERADGEVERVADRRVSLRPGDAIEVTTGSARFELADGVRYAGVAGRAGAHRAGTTVRMGNVPDLEAGDLLVTGPEPTSVSAGDTTVTTGPGGGAPGEGSALRLSRTLGLRVGVYRGSASLDSAGARRTVPGLRRMEVAAAGELPRTPRPLRFAADDRWDRRYLGDAIALDAELFSLVGAVEATGGADAGSVTYLRSVLPMARGEASLAELVRPRRVSTDVLVGAVIAGLGEDGSFARRWREVFTFHDAGATWGLVALDQEVETTAVSEAVRDALNDTEFPFQVDEAVATPASPAAAPPPSTSIPAARPGSSPPSTTTGPPATTTGPPSIDTTPGVVPVTGPPVAPSLPAAPPATVAPVIPAPARTPSPPGPDVPLRPSPGGSGGGGGGGEPPPGTVAPTAPPAPVPTRPPSQITLPPGTVAPPETTLPAVTVPPVTVAPAGITLPPLTVAPPETTLPAVTVPPVILPPLTLPPLLVDDVEDVGQSVGDAVSAAEDVVDPVVDPVVDGATEEDGLLDPVLGG